MNTSRRLEANPLELLDALNGQPVSLVDSAYGDELVLGFGTTEEEVTRAGVLEKSQWMLYTREAPWVLDTIEGVVATHRQVLNERRLRTTREALAGASVEKAQIRNELLALTVAFDNGASLIMTPPRDTRLDQAVWALSTPEGVVVAIPDTGLTVVPGDEPAQAMTRPRRRRRSPNRAEVARSQAVNSAGRVRAARLHYGMPLDEREWRRLLRNIATEGGFDVFEPLGAVPIADALFMTPSGKVVVVELKTERRKLTPAPHVPRLVIVVGQLEVDERVAIDEASSTRVVRLGEKSEHELATVVRDLAAAA